MPILFALVGATGIGKSKLSISLAEHYNAEIIGVDSRQIYKDFAIGTAQPPKEDLDRVVHHLVNFQDPREPYSAGDFCRDVKHLVQAHPEQNYIMVGGTGLYLQSLMLGLPQIPKVDPEIRSRLDEVVATSGGESLYRMAMSADPEATAAVEGLNIQRLTRIVEVWQATGRKLSEWQKDRVGGIGKLPIFWLQRSRENLYARINQRVDQMMDDGWMEEARSLAQRVPLEAPAWLSLGYRELLQANSAAEVGAVVDEVKRKTRNYAKRQLTWFRWQVESTEIDLDKSKNPLNEITDKIINLYK